MRERFEGARIWLVRKMPASLLWHPFEWFMAGLCALSGILTFFVPSDSPTLQTLFPEVVLKGYAAILILGALALAGGLSSIRAVDRDRYTITRVPTYRLGLRLLGLSMCVYVTALITLAGWAGVPASITPAAFALMCMVRLLALGGR